MPRFPILVASYTNDIVTLEFDSDSATLKPVSSVTVGYHPSWVEGHPTDKSLVFTGLEQTDGKLVALRYDASGKGTVISKVSSIGADPCSVHVDKDVVFAANVCSYILYDEILMMNQVGVMNQSIRLGLSPSHPFLPLLKRGRLPSLQSRGIPSSSPERDRTSLAKRDHILTKSSCIPDIPSSWCLISARTS